MTHFVLLALPKYNHHLNLYASLLQIFEFMLPRLSSEELEPILDLILSSETIKKLQVEEVSHSNALCDVLSLISVHCMMESGGGVLLERMLNGEFLTNLVGLLEQTNLQVKQ
jgi:hypothetical protein